jgi:hypothetical protein
MGRIKNRKQKREIIVTMATKRKTTTLAKPKKPGQSERGEGREKKKGKLQTGAISGTINTVVLQQQHDQYIERGSESGRGQRNRLL